MNQRFGENEVPVGRGGGLMARLEDKIRGWEWVAAEFRRVLTEAAAERERLLGPDRGE